MDTYILNEEEFPPLPKVKCIKGWGHFHLKGGAPSDKEELQRLETLYNNSGSPAVRMGLKFKIDALKKKMKEAENPPVSSEPLRADFANMYEVTNFSDTASISSSVKAVCGDGDKSIETEENVEQLTEPIGDMSLDPEDDDDKPNEPKVFKDFQAILHCYYLN